MFDYVVVGSGFAGSVIAERIATKLEKKVLLIEKRKHIGGNSYDFKDKNNILVHKYGPHLFHTNNQNVFHYLSKFTNWNIYNHRVLANIDGNNVSLPFNIKTIYKVFPESLAKRLEKKLLENYSLNTKVPILELKKTSDRDLQFLADFIYEKVFINYTIKQWRMKPEDLDGAVTARVPIFIGYDNRYFNDKYQVLPSNGYTDLFNNLLSSKNIKIMLNTNIKEILSISSNNVSLFGTKFNGKLIYTGALDELFDYRFGILPYRSVNMTFETIDKEKYQEAATINYPNNYDFTRITEFKHFYYYRESRTTILKEYPIEYDKNLNDPYYPVFSEEAKKQYDKYKDYANNFSNLVLLGRLAEYKYYDMDDIVEKALNVFEEEIR